MRRLRALLLCGFMAVLVACGGGGGGGTTATGNPLVSGIPVAANPATNPLRSGQVETATPAAVKSLDAAALMDWAEIRYPQYFPGQQVDQTALPYVYRYYPDTNTYLGVDGDSVRVHGPAFGSSVLTVGRLSDFACLVFPESCAPPVATISSQQEAIVGSTVLLDGSASSDPGGLPLTFAWVLTTKPASSTTSLNSTSIANPTFVADAAGVYIASLTVSNGTHSSAIHTVTVTATAPVVAPVTNAPPSANAGGSRSVIAGTSVILDGSGSTDPNGDALTYVWTLVSKPSGSNTTLSNAATRSPTFRADVAGTYTVSLVVSDGKSQSAPSTVSVTATSTSAFCCKYCSTGKPCGDSCISKTYSCSKIGGCACYG